MISKSVKEVIRSLLRPLKGLQFKHLKRQVKCPTKWYGNDYGGFYINPTALNENSVVYSFGIGEDISFDETIIKTHNCEVFGFDPTPKSIQWVKDNVQNKKFIFCAYGIANNSGHAFFNLPKNPDYVSGSLIDHLNVDCNSKVEVEMRSFSDIVNHFSHSRIDVLKMDIEGSEYSIIESVLQSGIQIGQILVEFHERFFDDGYKKTISFIELMNHHGFEIFAISNTYEEVSFINVDVL